MKKLFSLLFSNTITLLALIAFAISMAVATFMENDYGTPVAREVVYDAWWFECLMLILTVNFIGNIYRYKLLRKEKRSILTFHLAFIIILIGAGVSRYTGFEGLVRIREGQSTNQIISQQRYLSINTTKDDKHWSFRKALSLTKLEQPNLTLEWGEEDNPLVVQVKRYVPDAVQTLVDGDAEVIELVAAIEEGRRSFYLSMGSSVFVNGHEITFNNEKPDAINMKGKNGNYFISPSEDLSYMIMANQRVGQLAKGATDTLQKRALYQSDHLNFVISQIHLNKSLAYKSTEDKEMAKNAADLLFVDLIRGKEKKQVILAALDGVFSPLQETNLSNYHIHLSYGPELVPLPFSLKLTDFQLERYPGSVSPSSYASELIVEDADGDFPVRISMNNVLDHRGYRFFQASYDLDELGTVLSVNRDFWGTQVTYLGYLLMGVGMLLALFGKSSRFQLVSSKLNKLKTTTAMIMLIPVLVFGTDSKKVETEQANLPIINASHAAQFGQLLVQDMDGRIKPINTLASEFLRKLTRKTSYQLVSHGENYKLNEDQLFLSIHQNPIAWQNRPLIKVDHEKGRLILLELGLEGQSMISFQDLIDEEGNYRLRMAVEAAQRRKPAERSEHDKEIIKVDERFNILYQALAGHYLKVFPQPEAQDNMWFNAQFERAGFSSEDSLFVRNILTVYYRDLEFASQTNEWTEADEKLRYIKTFQDTMGKEIIPDQDRVYAELLYNDLQIFNRLFPIYWLLGIYLLTLAVLRVFFQNQFLNIGYWVGVWGVGFAFVAETANIMLRWYAADYPPWSNGYEMIILVSWALLLFGFIFFRKSDFILPVATLFTGTLLFVSYLDWLNPEITNLVPVLKSYWLKIHVAIIVSSYAPLALSALLGLLSLIFMTTRNELFKKPIAELTYINEMSMTIGLFMLAIGTFLGGVWANESWGRYWGWDPKETWALISIIIYAVVLHMRLIPSLRGVYTFSLASVIAFFSIIMTSFGVNYYLSGLHSYAAGDPVPIPTFAYWVVGFVFLLGMVSFWRKMDVAN